MVLFGYKWAVDIKVTTAHTYLEMTGDSSGQLIFQIP